MIQRTLIQQRVLQNLCRRQTCISRSQAPLFRSLPSCPLLGSLPHHCNYSSTSNKTTEQRDRLDKESEPSEDDGLPTKEDPLRKELEAKNREIIDLKDKYLRSVADFRNLQDRTARDVSSARDFAITRFAKDLLDSVDNFDRALSTVPSTSLTSEAPNKELKDLHNGLKMTESILLQTLARNGLSRFDPSEKEEKFDPNLHEATFMTKVDGKEDGVVFNTVQKGFTLNGRVIRAAKVGVVKNT